MDISKAIAMSAAGLGVPAERLRAMADNLAEQDGGGTVGARSAGGEPRGFATRDLRPGERDDSARLNVVRTTRAMLSRTIELLG